MSWLVIGLRQPYEIAATVLIVASIFFGLTHQPELSRLSLAGGMVTFLCGDILTRQWGYVACDVAYLAWLTRNWWKPKGKRAAEMLGAKSKAARDALVRRARELSRPRPVLRPVPVPR